jgi:hypothetical protein
LADVTIELARPQDDLAIQRVLADNPLPGRVVLSVEHAPSYFLGCQTMGTFHQVIVGRDQESGEVVGMACRAARPRFVNGQVELVGYLTHLRVDRRYRGRWLVSLGYRFIRKLHADGRVAGYITIVHEENREALGVLVHRARGSIPNYREVCRLVSLAIVVRRPKPLPRTPYDVRRGSEAELEAIVGCLRRYGSARQFFPAYDVEDFKPGSTFTLGFNAEDFFVAYRDGEPVGVLGLWDRSSSKQTVVRAYNGHLKWGRPLYNAGARLVGAQPLPAVGERLSSAYASFACVADSSPDVFAVLLRHVYNLAAERRYATLILDLADRDPLLAVARRYLNVPLYRRLYTVTWEDNRDFHERLDGRIPYVDTAAL